MSRDAAILDEEPVMNWSGASTKIAVRHAFLALTIQIDVFPFS
jgi:hypothetical protein